eukprot:213798-Pyramimonas_sp.AAC.1
MHESAYVWQWLPWRLSPHLLDPHATDPMCTIAVAVMSEPMRVEGYAHMISLSQIWKLCGMKQPIAKRLTDDSGVWETCYDLGVDPAHFCRSTKSASMLDWARSRRDDVVLLDGGASSLQFTSFMGTALFFFTLLVSVVSMSNQAGQHLQWAFMVISHCFDGLPSAFSFDCLGVRISVVGGLVSYAMVDQVIFRKLGLQSKWLAVPRAGQGVAHPRVVEGPRGCTVSFAYVFYFLARHYNDSRDATAAVRAMLHRVSHLVDRSWSALLLPQPR